MANEMLLTLVRITLALSTAIVLIMVLRQPVRHWFGAKIAYALWLVTPVAMCAVLLPAPQAPTQLFETSVQFLHAPAVLRGPDFLQVSPHPVRADVAIDYAALILMIWLGGAVAALALLALRQRRFLASLGRLRADALDPRILHAEACGIGPAVVGALTPKLVLPADFETRFDAQERAIMLAHERSHLASGDAQINALAALAQCLSWFNPLIHLAVRYVRIDQELACDAAVVARFPRVRRLYAETLLKTQLAPLALPLGCYWPPQSNHPLKERISMLKRDLPSRGRFAAGVVAAGLLSLTTGYVTWSVQPAAAAPVEQSADGRKLVLAIQRDDFAGSAALIEAGADINYHRRADPTPLIAAVWRRNLPLVKLLLNNGADVNLAAPGDGNALIAASARGYTDVVAELIARGADVNAKVLHDETPLMNAARDGKLDTVIYLVEHGADVNLAVMDPTWFRSAPRRRSPLGLAKFFHHTAVVAYLTSKGAI